MGIFDKVSKIFSNDEVIDPNLSAEALFAEGNARLAEREYTKAIPYLRAAADKNQVDAQVALAIIYSDPSMKTDYKAAFQYAEAAANQWDARGMYLLGNFYTKGYGTAKNLSIACGYFKQAAKRNHLGAIVNLGLFYRNGSGTEKDYQEAYRCFAAAVLREEELRETESAAKCAYYNLGWLYEMGYGTNQNMPLAKMWYKKAADLGYSQASEALLRMIHTIPAAFDENILAVSEANFTAEDFYEKGYQYNRTGEYEPAVTYYMKAAEKGHARAQSIIASCYENGQVLERDLQKAFYYYKKAAMQNEADALFKVGEMYLIGDVTEKNEKEAYRLIRAALDRVYDMPEFLHGQIYYVFGYCCEYGCGTNQDLQTAVQSYEKSQELNDPRAAAALERARKTIAEKAAREEEARNGNIEVKTENSGNGQEAAQPRPELKLEDLPENLDSYFEGIIGMETVKKQLEDIYNYARAQIRRRLVLQQRGLPVAENQKSYNFALLGNPGTGKTMVARIIAKILYDLHIHEQENIMEVDRSGLVGAYTGQTEEKVRGVLESARGGTLFIDEAYTLYKENAESDYGREVIDVLMKDMEDNRDAYSVIIAGYKKPMMNMINNANPGFGSRFNYQIEIPDYTDEELIAIAHSMIRARGFETVGDVDNAMKKWIQHERIDETFGNARAMRSMVEKALENQGKRLTIEASDEELFQLMPGDFFAGNADEEGIQKYLDELNALIGLKSVKEEVNRLIRQIQVNIEKENRGLQADSDFGTLHMAFLGNAGTGKTTVARLIGKLYAALGILKRNDVFVECNRGLLVGEYQGQTAVKVQKVVQSALGGVLFIDEAYSLVQGVQDSYGKEALDTLVAEIENHRDNLLVIFAGYKSDMNTFFANNQGMKSRVPTTLLFEDLTVEELFTVMQSMLAKKGMHLSENAVNAAKQAIASNMEEADFGNARGVRNMVDAMLRNQANRIAGMMERQQEVTDDMFLAIEWEDL